MWVTATYDIAILIHIQLFHNGVNRLVVRSVLDDLHGRLEILDGDLSLAVTLDRIERRTDALVIRFELVVNLFDHASDALVERDLR